MQPNHKICISKIHIFKETASVNAFEKLLSEDTVVGRLKGWADLRDVSNTRDIIMQREQENDQKKSKDEDPN